MKRISTTSDVSNLGTILCLGAHPDDETFLAGGLMAAAVRAGQEVICITATKGELGVQDEVRWPHEKLGSIRQIELQNALDTLGVQRHYWLPFHDGQCDQVDEEEAITLLKPIFREHRPDSVLTFGPEGMTGHPDHATMSHWVDRLVNELDWDIQVFHAVVPQDLYDTYLADLDKKLNMFFNIDEPPLKSDDQCDIALELPPDLCRVKCEALRIMESQTSGIFKLIDDDTVCKAWAKEAFIRAGDINESIQK